MWTVVRDILTSPAGSVTFIGGILFGFAFIIYKGGRLMEKFEHQREGLKEMKGHTDGILDVKANHGVFEKRLDKIETKVDHISESLGMLRIDLAGISKQDAFTQRNSPLSLTSKGIDFVGKYDIVQMVDDNWCNINEIAQRNESKNPYDIQEFLIRECALRLGLFVGEEKLESLKLIAYNEGIDISSIARMIAIIVRDRYFKEHDIEISEIDKHDPNK